MKKKILILGLALSMLTSGLSAFAQEDEIMLINEETAVETVEEVEAIEEVAEEEAVEETEEVADAEAVEEIEEEVAEEVEAPVINFEEVIIGEDKDFELIYDNTGKKLTAEELKDGDKALLFKEGDKNIALVVMTEAASMAAIDVFTASETLGEYVDTQNNLAINVADETVIVDTEENELTKEDIEGKKLMVFYTFATMSIPAQTTPEKIVVLADEEVVEEVIEEAKETEEIEKVTYTVKAESIIKDGEIVTLPLREVSEGMGLEVAWDGFLQKITVGTVPMGVNFVVGVNEYNKARMMPFTLEKAPELVINGEYGVTYVPMSFFTEVLGAEVTENEDGTITFAI